CAKRKKTERYAFLGLSMAEKAIQNFVGRAVAAHRDESPIALRVSLCCELDGVAAAHCSNHVHCQAASTQLPQGLPGKLRGFDAARRGIDDGEKILFVLGHGYKESIAEERSSCARRSARTFLFIFKEAVRGKSSSRSTTP